MKIRRLSVAHLLAVLALVAAAGCSSSSGSNGSGGRGGGGSGGGNTGGAQGGGAGGNGPAAGCPSNLDDLISDFAIDNALHPADGRQGGWYVYGDTFGTFDPPKDDSRAYPIDLTTGNPNCSAMPGSLRVKGTGFRDWGAAAGTDFKPRVAADGGAMPPKGTYDATKYRGVSFWAKASAPVSFVQVKFPDINTDTEAPIADPCILTAGSQYNCSPYLVKFGEEPTDGGLLFPNYASSKIDTTWKRFEVLFADTRQDPGNPGLKPPGDKLDVANLLGMAVQVNANYSTTPQTANDFEIWIDDVQFIK
jgi:hypothetical protein